MSKIKDLEDMEGMDIEEMLEEATYDSVAKGICINEGRELLKISYKKL